MCIFGLDPVPVSLLNFVMLGRVVAILLGLFCAHTSIWFLGIFIFIEKIFGYDHNMILSLWHATEEEDI